MKKRVLSFGVLLLLTACSATSLVYRLEIVPTDAAQRSALIAASQRVIERRLASMGEKNSMIETDVDKGKLLMKVEVEAKVVAETLTAELTEPFALRIMSEAPDGQGDITVEGHGAFKETGLTEEHLLWVTASKDTDPAKGRVVLDFTPEGRTLMGEVFKKNKGKFIGLFVRKHLVSKLLVDATEVKDSIIITDIPSVLLAEIFADDINVGLHVTFVPEP